ncbi:unannotated protein [freshwater metagenome]|uniref:Unannotated protein n=1 Tax=freshwater metagenome TaxID=449393 RepID=A0A6J6ASM7_9ZZZZ
MLVDHVQNRVIIELHRHVIPKTLHLTLGADPCRLFLTNGAHSPTAVTSSPPRIRSYLEGVLTTRNGARPAPRLSQPRGVEHNSAVRAHKLPRFFIGRHCTNPSQVKGQIKLIRLADNAKLLEWTNHLYS